jgi:hypothetical protein
VSTLQVCIRTAEVLIGALLLYLRFFLYESEEGRLQNALTDLWIRVEDHSQNVSRRFSQLLTETALLANRFFDRIFGSRLLSWRALCVSTYFGFGSAILFLALIEVTGGTGWASIPAAIFIVLGLLPVFTSRPSAPYPAILLGALILFVCLGFMVFLLIEVRMPLEWKLLLLGIAFLAAAIPSLVEFLWVAVYRLALRKSTRSDHWRSSLWRQCASLILSLAASAAAMMLPGLVIGSLPMDQPDTPFTYAFIGLAFALMARLFLTLVTMAHATTLAILLAHRVVWPALSRLVYAAERFKIFRERTLFGTVGTAFMIKGLGGWSWMLDFVGLE